MTAAGSDFWLTSEAVGHRSNGVVRGEQTARQASSSLRPVSSGKRRQVERDLPSARLGSRDRELWLLVDAEICWRVKIGVELAVPTGPRRYVHAAAGAKGVAAAHGGHVHGTPPTNALPGSQLIAAKTALRND